MVLDGRVRDKVHRREKALNGFTKTDGAKTVLRRKNGESQQVEYSVVIPYEPWLGAARLVLREQTTGCAECDKGTEETPVKSTFLQLFQPKYTVAFVPPLKEAVKMRDEVKVARLNFRQDSHKIDPKFQNNRQELDSVRHSIAMVKITATSRLRVYMLPVTLLLKGVRIITKNCPDVVPKLLRNMCRGKPKWTHAFGMWHGVVRIGKVSVWNWISFPTC